MSDYDSEEFMDYDSDEVFEYSDAEIVDSDSGNAPSSQAMAALRQGSQPQNSHFGAADETQDFSENFYDDDDYFAADTSGFEPVLSKRQLKKPWEVDYLVYDAKGLRKKQEATIDRLEPLLSISRDATTVLLRCYLWKEESLVEDYLNDPDRALTKVGLCANPPTPKLQSGDEEFTCGICFCEGPEEQYLALSCGHRFCTDCYTQYITGKVREGESWRIRCPAHKCKTLVGEESSRLLLAGSADTLTRYEDNLTRSFVNDLESFSWCPAPNCEYAVECHVPRSAWTTVVPTVKCSCEKAFCFGCKLDDHMPVPCFLVERWLQKCKDDSETSNWIKAHTKECTKCKATIEKNGGCNHMTCRECHYEFCWVCMGPWSEHGQTYYQCNRFNEDSSKNARDSISKSRALLERYLHYYTRFNNHEQSAKLARKLLAYTEKTMEKMQRESTLSWIEVQFLSDAVDVLSICRSTLKWSYVLAYYMEADNQKIIFENNQSDLEMATEQLNELVENPIGQDSIEVTKRKIIDKTTYVKSRWETLLSDTALGLQENRWKFDC
ncbi:hypothetical protein GGI12_001439 [Dipsacomyces acuminosporus]|nr:hypothetical protein GGI12_001439 [Dipsacomyces acuminosporus]